MDYRKVQFFLAAVRCGSLTEAAAELEVSQPALSKSIKALEKSLGVPLLERGLTQIRDIVGALLIEARAKGRALGRQDIEDVHTLLAQEAKKRGVEWTWDNSVSGDLPLPATLVR